MDAADFNDKTLENVDLSYYIMLIPIMTKNPFQQHIDYQNLIIIYWDMIVKY